MVVINSLCSPVQHWCDRLILLHFIKLSDRSGTGFMTRNTGKPMHNSQSLSY
ncbi:hypothetical protein [Phormidesmis priestleyi]